VSLLLPSSITLPQAGQVLEQLRAAMRAQAQGPLLVDASALQALDSSALAVLLQCRREARASSRDLQISGAPDKLLKLMQLYGVSEILPQRPFM